jgi:hypothetical protein
MQVKFHEEVVCSSTRWRIDEATPNPLLVVPDTELGFLYSCEAENHPMCLEEVRKEG